MDIRMIEAEFSRASTVGDLFPIIGHLIERQIEFERELEDKLGSLDSSNVKEIDFAMTRVKNLKIGG